MVMLPNENQIFSSKLSSFLFPRTPPFDCICLSQNTAAAVPPRASVPADPGACGRWTCSGRSSGSPGWAPSSEAGCAAGLAVLGSAVPLRACPGLGLTRTAGFSLTLDNRFLFSHVLLVFPVGNISGNIPYQWGRLSFVPLNCCSS